MKKIIKWALLVAIGGFTYYAIEMMYRGRSHWSMIIVGGICFWSLGMINEVIPWEMSLITQALIGSCIVTGIEFLSGVILNIFLKWGIWDYSNMHFNILGQICLPFSIIWFFLAGAGIIYDDYLRYWIFKEKKPHYILFRIRKDR